MVFAAGRGTRLRPFTDKHPKCLAPVGEKTLLQLCLENLRAIGIDRVVINLHHFADQVIQYLKQNGDFDLSIEVSLEQELLETGGGLYSAREHFTNESMFLALNSDIYTDLDLWLLLQAHEENNALATLAVAQRDTSRYLQFNEEMTLSGWENQKTGEQIRWMEDDFQRYAFNGIQVLSPRVFDFMENRGAHFSTIAVYLDAARSGERIKGFRMDDAYWIDIGEQEKLEKLQKHLS